MCDFSPDDCDTFVIIVSYAEASAFFFVVFFCRGKGGEGRLDHGVDGWNLVLFNTSHFFFK